MCYTNALLKEDNKECIISIKWGESTHFPGRNAPVRIYPGRTGNRGETFRYPWSPNGEKKDDTLTSNWKNEKSRDGVARAVFS